MNATVDGVAPFRYLIYPSLGCLELTPGYSSTAQYSSTGFRTALVCLSGSRSAKNEPSKLYSKQRKRANPKIAPWRNTTKPQTTSGTKAKPKETGPNTAHQAILKLASFFLTYCTPKKTPELGAIYLQIFFPETGRFLNFFYQLL